MRSTFNCNPTLVTNAIDTGHRLSRAPLGAPITLKLKDIPTCVGIVSAAHFFFEFIKQGGLAQINENDLSESKRRPWGEDFTRLLEIKVSGKRLGYEKRMYFPREDDQSTYATAEKIYLEPRSFDHPVFSECHSGFQILSKLYSIAECFANGISEELHAEPHKIEFRDQLMLIRYSACAGNIEKMRQLAAIGSEEFGINHDDETFFSLHLAESIPELNCWDYSKHQWTRATTIDGQTQLLLGDYARVEGWIPTTHRLTATSWMGADARYSIIFDRAPVDRRLWEPQYADDGQDFMKLTNRSPFDFTQLAIVMSEPSGAIKHQVSSWLAAIGYAPSPAAFVAAGDSAFADLAKRGFSKALVINSKDLWTSHKPLLRLLCNSLVYDEKYLFRLKIPDSNSALLVNLAGGRGAVIDSQLNRSGWLKLHFELPSNFDPDSRIQSWLRDS